VHAPPEAGARVLSAPRAALAVVNGDLNFCLFFRQDRQSGIAFLVSVAADFAKSIALLVSELRDCCPFVSDHRGADRAAHTDRWLRTSSPAHCMNGVRSCLGANTALRGRRARVRTAQLVAPSAAVAPALPLSSRPKYCSLRCLGARSSTVAAPDATCTGRGAG